MKPALFASLIATMTFLIVVVLLNVRRGGPDVFYGGSLSPVNPDLSQDPVLARLIPAELKHACPTCGECVHPVEIVSNRRSLTIRDHHRWFQLFHAADRTYYFDDLVQFAGCFKNRSALDPEGGWEIVARLGPAKHGKSEPHACGRVATGFTATYRLVTREAPIDEGTSDAGGPAGVADQVQALAFRYQTPSSSTVLHFGWALVRPPGSLGPPPVPCPCGKP